jgi:hypothetical protein
MDNIQIIKSFKQGGTGNCVCIAIIKAGIEIFGLNNIFHHRKESDGTHSITMRDGFELSVTAEEYEKAKIGSKFLLLENEEVYSYAILCFAAMAKRALTEGDEGVGYQDFDGSISAMNDGQNYYKGPYWLGLRHNYRNIGRKYAKINPGCVGASRVHCFYVSYGIEDSYGQPDKIGLFERNFANWYRITPEQYF